MRLQFHPHDADAHRELISLLRKKNAFRALVAEDITWLGNNRSDVLALTEIISYSEVALYDPELAIAQLQLHLSSVQRAEDPDGGPNLVEGGRRAQAFYATCFTFAGMSFSPRKIAFKAQRSL